MAIDWNWPVEFHDGTPAWVASDQNGAVPGLVLCEDKPFGVPVARFQRIYSMLADDNDPRLRNIDMPEIRFEKWNAAPVRASFVSSSRIKLWLNATDEDTWEYSWPTLKSIKGAPSVITLNRKQLAEAETQEAEQAELESSDLYGMF